MACPYDIHSFPLIFDSPCKQDSMLQSGSLYLPSQCRSFRTISDNKQSSFRYVRQDGVPRRNR